MKLIFHGAAREVGRSCIELQTGGDRYLLDFGIKFVTEGFKYPESVDKVEEIDGVLLSHAHLDHSGGLPLLEYHRLVCPIFCTHQTLALTKILLKDSYKIAHIKHLHPAYDKTNIRQVTDSTRRVQFDKWYSHRKLKFKFLNAGHIPGSAAILIEAEGKFILYTGDFNTRTTKLMIPASFAEQTERIDCLISESTYGNRNLPARADVEPAFLDAVERVLKREGTALVPVFAVGRAQEILVLLSQREWNCPIYFDGMAKEVTRKVLTNQSTYVTNKEPLNNMYFNRVKYVASDALRQQATREKAIIVTTSGMMQGGPAIRYLKELWHDPKNAVFLTGYQVHGTNGRHLIDEGYIHIDGWKTPVKCEVKKFDFSGHADKEDVKRTVWKIHPKVLIFQHGNEESVANMVEWAKRETPFKVYGPHIGDEIEL